MGKYTKIILQDEDGNLEEHDHAVVVTTNGKDKASLSLVSADGMTIAIAAYAIVSAVEEMGLYPLLEALTEQCTVESVEIQSN